MTLVSESQVVEKNKKKQSLILVDGGIKVIEGCYRNVMLL